MHDADIIRQNVDDDMPPVMVGITDRADTETSSLTKYVAMKQATTIEYLVVFMKIFLRTVNAVYWILSGPVPSFACPRSLRCRLKNNNPRPRD
jgi:hypothetical protein